jgi:hypothetical protein
VKDSGQQAVKAKSKRLEMKCLKPLASSIEERRGSGLYLPSLFALPS